MSVDELIDGWQAAWSGKDPAAFADVCAAGIQYEDPLTGEPVAGLEQTGARLHEGAFVAAPCKAVGTHREALEGLPATNRFVVVHCIFYCELQHELLLRVRAFYDVYDAATQLGVLPARGTLGEKALLMLRGFGLRSARG
jgi:hypothetical protein